LPTLGEAEEGIFKVEHFCVAFLHASGRNARSNKTGFLPYPYKYKLDDDLTVADWIKKRGRPTYAEHGYDIAVLYADGTRAHGGTKLRQIRANYK